MPAHTGPQRSGSWAQVNSGEMSIAAGEFWDVTPADREQLTRHGVRFMRSVMLAFQQLICDMHAANLSQVELAWHAFQFAKHVG